MKYKVIILSILVIVTAIALFKSFHPKKAITNTNHSFWDFASNKYAIQKEIQTKKEQALYYSPAERDSLMKILAGDWLRKTYYDELIRTKSPYQALKGSGVTEFEIHSDDYNTNCFDMNIQLEFHQYDLVQFKMVRNDTISFVGKSYHVKLTKDTNQILFYDDYNGKSDIDYAPYIKCTSIDSLVNSIILAGSYYDVKDDSKKPITFHPKGSLDGLGNMKTYRIMLDLYNSDFDLIVFDKDPEPIVYIYETKGDYLLFYDAIETGYGADSFHTKGKLLYTLHKVVTALEK